MTTIIVNLLVTSLGIALLLAFWHLMWRPLAVAHLRQDLFDARDALFDKVAAGQYEMTFESPVYRAVRRDLNSMIRYSHGVSLFQSLMGGIFVNPKRTELLKCPGMQRRNLTPDERRVVMFAISRQRRALTKYLLAASPLFWALILIGFAVLVCYFCFTAFKLGFKVCDAVTQKGAKLVADMLRPVELQLGQEYLSRFNGLKA